MNKLERITQNLIARDPGFAVEYAAASLLGELITQRVCQGLTQADVAERSGLTQSAVARIEGLSSNVTLATLVKYASAIGSKLGAEPVVHSSGRRYPKAGLHSAATVAAQVTERRSV